MYSIFNNGEDLMKKGDLIQVDGKRFKIQKVIHDSFYASQMVSEDKCQRGKPRRFFFTDVASALGTTVEELKASAVTNKSVMKIQLTKSEVDLPDESEPEKEITAEEVLANQNSSPLHEVLDEFDLKNSSDDAW